MAGRSAKMPVSIEDLAVEPVDWRRHDEILTTFHYHEEWPGPILVLDPAGYRREESRRQ